MAQDPNKTANAMAKAGCSLTLLVWVLIPFLALFSCGIYAAIASIGK